MTKKRAIKSKKQTLPLGIKQEKQTLPVGMKEEPSGRGNKSERKRVTNPSKSPAKSGNDDMNEEPSRRGRQKENKRGTKREYKRDSAESPTKNAAGEDVNPNPSLPFRLLATDELPDRARLNIYSKPEYLGILVELLEGSETWDLLMASQFRKLFELPVARCSHSAKLIHGMLARQLLTHKRHELWTVYGGFPLRFSLREFHITTGLICKKIPTVSEVEDHQDPAYLSVWNRLFGGQRIVSVLEVIDMIRGDINAEPKKRFSKWKKLSLALIVLVDGVVVCNNTRPGRVSGPFVEMLHDIDFFMSYPWGRVTFEATMERFGPSLLEADPIGELKTRLSQKSSCCYGFPLALQLQVLTSIPALCSRIKDPADFRNFIQRPSTDLSRTILLRETDVVEAEYNPNLTVEYTLYHSEPLKGDLTWPDEVVDPGVDLIISLINQKHEFKPQMWPVHQIPCAPSTDKEKKETDPKKATTPEEQEGQGTEGGPLDTEGTDVVDLHSDDAEEKATAEPSKSAKRSRTESYHFPRKPLTRSAKLAEELVGPQPSRKKAASHKKKENPPTSADATTVPQPAPKKTGKQIPNHEDVSKGGGGSSSCQFVTQSDMSDLKVWIGQQLCDLRTNINDDILKLVEGQSHLRKPVDPQTKTSESKAKKKKEKPESKKRKREEVTSLSSGSSSTGLKDGLSKDIPIRKDGGTGGNFEGSADTWDLYGAAKTISQKIHADIHASPIGNSNAEDTNAGEGEKDVGEEELFAVSPKQSRATPLTPSVQKIPADIPASPNPVSNAEGSNAEEPQKETDEEERVAGSPKQTPDTPVTPFAQVVPDSHEDSAGTDCKYRNLSSIVAASPAYFVIESTNPRQPLPCKRVPRRSRFLDPAEYSIDPRISALFKSRTKEPAYTPLPELDDGEFLKFKALLENDTDSSFTVCTGHKLTNGHFLDIATKEKWVTTEHMQLITGMLVRRRGKAYSQKRVAIIDTWFASLIATHYEDFMKCKDKERFEWGSSIKAYVTGKSTGIHMKSEFLKHVDVVYVPMNWGCYHWVGLVINLKLRTIEILDSFLSPTPEEAVAFLMAPMVDCIPWLLKRFCCPTLTTNLTTEPFACSRITGLYDNKGDGDCGPVSCKFLEMHAHGMEYAEMSALTDEVITRVRKIYAMDTYAAFVECEDEF